MAAYYAVKRSINNYWSNMREGLANAEHMLHGDLPLTDLEALDRVRQLTDKAEHAALKELEEMRDDQLNKETQT